MVESGNVSRDVIRTAWGEKQEALSRLGRQRVSTFPFLVRRLLYFELTWTESAHGAGKPTAYAYPYVALPDATP